MKIEDLVTVAQIVFSLLVLYFGVWSAVALWPRRETNTEPCPRCGKPVTIGAELYHAKRCVGLQSQRSYKFGRGERIDR